MQQPVRHLAHYTLSCLPLSLSRSFRLVCSSLHPPPSSITIALHPFQQMSSSFRSMSTKWAMPHLPTCSKQLELTVISAQDLKKEKLFGPIRAYAVAWIKPHTRLATQVDAEGDANPTWNGRFTFRVEKELLTHETAAVMIKIYDAGLLRDTLLGTVRVLLSNLTRRGEGYQGAQFLTVQIRRPSGRPQGILNIGSMLLDCDKSRSPLVKDVWKVEPEALAFYSSKDVPASCNRNDSGQRVLAGKKESYKMSAIALESRGRKLELKGEEEHEEKNLQNDVKQEKSDEEILPGRINIFACHTTMVNNLTLWTKKAKVLRKGAAKIHLSPSDRNIEDKLQKLEIADQMGDTKKHA